MQVRPAGDRAFLIELGDVSAEELHRRAVEMRSRDGVIACIVGHSSLYVVVAGSQLPVAGTEVATGNWQPVTHSIPVLFERDPIEVTLRARYLGFRAGFAYLEGWPPELAMPRLATSRPVARGSFAIAGTMAGFYPIDTPGGWNILGRTSVTLWDPNREPPNLIAPGDVVHVVPVSELPPAEPLLPAPSPGGDVIAEVVSPGQLTRIVGPRDWSRVEHGLAPGGAFDDFEGTLLECVLVAPRLRFVRPTRVTWWDGDVVESRVVEELDLGRLRSMRAYIGIEGGVDEMRPRYAEEATRLVRGMKLYAGGAEARGRSHDADRHDIAVMPGPHEPSISEVECEVTPHIDRVGIRLRPLRDLGITAPRDLRSCGMQFGTVQLHPDGSLVAMGPDHPVTGGYLQPMTVLSSERWKLAQLAPGERVRFYSP